MSSRVCKQCQVSKCMQAYHQQLRRCKSTCIACMNDNAKRRRAENAARQKLLPAEKMCGCCQVSKDSGCFPLNRTEPDGLALWCKDCYNQKARTYKQKRREDHVAVCLTCLKEKPRGKMSAENTAKCKQCKQTRKTVRWSKDSMYRLQESCRSRVYKAIKAEKKASATIHLVGCTWEHLKEHLQQQFTEGMTWENHGLRGWHIDHIRPCASFDLSDPAQQAACFNFINLQPLWAKDNLQKGSKWIIL